MLLGIRISSLCLVTCRKVELIQKCGVGHSASSGVLGSEPQSRQLQKPITSMLGDTITRCVWVSQTFSHVKVKTNTGPGEILSSSKKWNILRENTCIYTIVVGCISPKARVQLNDTIHPSIHTVVEEVKVTVMVATVVVVDCWPCTHLSPR